LRARCLVTFDLTQDGAPKEVRARCNADAKANKFEEAAAAMVENSLYPPAADGAQRHGVEVRVEFTLVGDGEDALATLPEPESACTAAGAAR
jgi:hypothetical protein